MAFDGRDIGRLAGRYKKQIIIGVIALGLTFVAGVSLLGFIVYKSFDYTSDKVATWSSEAGEKIGQMDLPSDGTVPKLGTSPEGFVEGFVLTVASQLLEQGLASQEAVQIKNGLACFDAVGGPSPETVVGFLQSKTNEEHVVRKLADLSEALTNEIGEAGPSACAHWVLNG